MLMNEAFKACSEWKALRRVFKIEVYAAIVKPAVKNTAQGL